MKTLRPALGYRDRPVPGTIFHRPSTRRLARLMEHAPRESLTALLRQAGPFIPERDGFGFSNTPGWALTKADGDEVIRRYQDAADRAGDAVILVIRNALLGFPIDLPQVVVAEVINRVTAPLRNEILASLVDRIPGDFGRCGGMAFAALDFFLHGVPMDSFKQRPSDDRPLYGLILRRLLDSLEGNVGTFLSWGFQLALLPIFSKTVSAALGAAAGSVGGPVGAAIGAFIGGKADILELGGAKSLLDPTREHLETLNARLEGQPAWPIGLVYGDEALPWYNHQILALRMDRTAGGWSMLVHDNNLFKGAGPVAEAWDVRTDGAEIEVRTGREKHRAVKGIICNEYSPAVPPPAATL